MEGGSNGFLIYQRTTTCINQNSCILHLLNGLGIDEMISIIRKRTMQRKNIACRKQYLLAHLLNPLRQDSGWLAGAGTHIHTKLVGNISHLHTDISQSHNTQCLAG